MTILKKLLMIFSLTLTLTIIISALSINALDSAQNRFEYVTSNSLPSIKKLSEALQHREEGRRQILMGLLVTEKDVFEKHMDTAKNELIEARKALAFYKAELTTDSQDAKLIDETIQLFDLYQNQVSEMVNAYNNNGIENARQMVSDGGATAAASVALSTKFKEIFSYNYKIAQDYVETSRAQYVKTLWFLVTLIIAAIVITAFFSYTILGYLKKSLHNLQNSMKYIGETLDLTVRVENNKKDELGATVASFNGLLITIRDVLSSVKASSKEVDTAANEIAISNDDLSSRTEAQASSLEQTAASMNELSATVKHNKDNAKAANTFIGQVQSIVKESHRELGSLKNSIDDISVSSQKISEITSIIDGIAFQTNILALNAAVEAARAGEQGKGFAVVAGEVRSLSQRSSIAAKDIRDLIEEAIKNVKSGVELAANVSTRMDDALTVVDETTQLINQVNHSSTEQSYGIEQVNIAVNQMEGNLQQNAAMVEQMATASGSLSQQAGKLLSDVNAFKL